MFEFEMSHLVCILIGPQMSQVIIMIMSGEEIIADSDSEGLYYLALL